MFSQCRLFSNDFTTTLDSLGNLNWPRCRQFQPGCSGFQLQGEFVYTRHQHHCRRARETVTLRCELAHTLASPQKTHLQPPYWEFTHTYVYLNTVQGGSSLLSPEPILSPQLLQDDDPSLCVCFRSTQAHSI